MAVRLLPAHGVGGGMEQVTWALATGLAERGHDVTVATTTHPAGVTEEHDAGVRVLYVGGSTWRHYRHRWWKACYAEMRTGRYDVMLSQSAGGLGYLRQARRDLGLPTVVLLHGSARAELRTAWRGARNLRGVYRLGRLGWRVPRQAMRWRAAAPAVADWMAVSHAVAADARRPSATVVPVGADTERFRPDAAARTRVRAELGIPPDALVVALATRLEPEKGVAVALEAARRLRVRHPDLQVVVAGTGHDAARLRATAPGYCRFLGLVSHDRLPAALATADVFVHSSLCVEGRPLSVVEASATGLPVVASDSAGTREAVVDGRTGLLVPRGDPGRLARALEELLTDAPGRATMGRAGRQAAESAWSSTSMVDAVESVLEDVVGARDHRP